MSDYGRQADRIQRTRDEEGEPQQARQVQPGSYRGAWSDTPADPPDWAPRPSYDSPEEAPPDLLQRALREKFPWVQRFVKEGCPRGKLVEYARAYAESQGFPSDDIPPYTTLNTWAHQLNAFGLVGLIDKVRSDAGTSRTVTGAMQKILEIAALGGKKGYRAALNVLVDWLPEGEEPPNYHAVRRALARFMTDNPHLVTAATKGIGRVKQMFRLSLSHGLLPGGVALAVDSTVADIFVRVRDATADSGFRAVRPVLTMIQDLGTRMIVTFNLSLYQVDSGIIKGTFRRAVNPECNYPGLLSTGVPEQVVVDRGSEHRGEFEQLMEQLGVDVRTSTEPEGRSSVERAIGSVTEEVFANEIGYSSTQIPFDPYAPPEQDERRSLRELAYEPYRLEVPVSSLLQIHELEASLLAWVQTHNQRAHSSLPVNSKQMQALLFDFMALCNPGPQMEDAA